MREPWIWDDDEKTLLYAVYRLWASHRRPPTMRDLHEATGFDRRRARAVARRLREGFALGFVDDRINLLITNAPPFSATPTTVACFLDDQFVSYVGCAMEATAMAWLPMYDGRILTMKSYCACCFEPIEFEMRRSDLVAARPVVPLLAVMGSPYDWEHGVPPDRVCDSFHFVLDEDHAGRFEHQTQRRAVTMTFDQIRELARFAGEGRMHDPQWKAIRVDGEQLVDRLESLGVDVRLWR